MVVTLTITIRVFFIGLTMALLMTLLLHHISLQASILQGVMVTSQRLVTLMLVTLCLSLVRFQVTVLTLSEIISIRVWQQVK